MRSILTTTLLVLTIAVIGAAGFGVFQTRHQGLQLEGLKRDLRAAEASARMARREDEDDGAAGRLSTALAAGADPTTAIPDNSQPLGPTGPLATRWLEKARALRQALAQHPERQIPELALLSDEEILIAAQTLPLDTDEQLRKAFNALRTSAKMKIPDLLQPAFRDFAAANGDRLPSTIGELAPYLKLPFTAEMLQRYEMVRSGIYSQAVDRTWVAAEKLPVDDQFDTRYMISPLGWGRSNVTKPFFLTVRAIAAFQAANENRKPTAAAQLRPYLEAPLEDDELQARFTAWEANPATGGLIVQSSGVYTHLPSAP